MIKNATTSSSNNNKNNDDQASMAYMLTAIEDLCRHNKALHDSVHDLQQ